MDTEDTRDDELVARLKRLDASAAHRRRVSTTTAMLDRHAARQARARRRLALARGAASALVVALVGASVWRFDQRGRATAGREVRDACADADPRRRSRASCAPTPISRSPRSRITSPARRRAQRCAPARRVTADVARLERTRAELFDSYTQVRYAEMVSANF